MLSGIYDRCGIITAHLIDPLSELINTIIHIPNDSPNAIGFYYESNKIVTTALFNIYDNHPVSWMKMGSTMDMLLASPYLDKISYYPLILDNTEASKAILTKPFERKNMNKLEEKFRALVIETIGKNASSIQDKNTIYTHLLLKYANISGYDLNPITGYSLVNKVLMGLMGITSEDKINTSIISCPLIKTLKSIVINKAEYPSDIEANNYIHECRKEITTIAAIFVDLFTTNNSFRTKILSKNNGFNHPLLNLSPLFARETELLSYITSSLQKGEINNNMLNDIILDLGKERFTLGNYQVLPQSIQPQPILEVSTEVLSCTFQQEDILPETNPLIELGTYISHIADSFARSEILTINLGGIIASYNKLIASTNLSKIKVPHIGGTNTISRTGIITIPGESDFDHLIVPIDSKHIAIPMYNIDMKPLSDAQLMDILIYIDSLRTSDGTGNTRYINIQNEITHELALRRKNA